MGSSDEQRNRIHAALEAARAGERDRFLSIVDGIDFKTAAHTDGIWLRAEQAYRNGRYAECLKLFAVFDHDKRSKQSPTWQRYLSAHRQAFSSFQLGMISQAEAHLDQAEALLREPSSG